MDDDEDDDDEDEDEDDYSENETEKHLRNVVDNLPSDLRRQVLKRGAAANKKKQGDAAEDSEDDDDEDEEEEVKDAGWGRKKGVYWSGDTGDLEIGQEMEDAEEEEEAAKVNSIVMCYVLTCKYFVYFINCCQIVLIGVAPRKGTQNESKRFF